MRNRKLPSFPVSSPSVGFLLCWLFFLAGSPNVSAAKTPPCDRACLTGILNQFLSDTVKHDPSAAPLFIAYRETENAIVINKGEEGLWKTLTGLGKVQGVTSIPKMEGLDASVRSRKARMSVSQRCV
jgi:hypothetical protein